SWAVWALAFLLGGAPDEVQKLLNHPHPRARFLIDTYAALAVELVVAAIVVGVALRLGYFASRKAAGFLAKRAAEGRDGLLDKAARAAPSAAVAPYARDELVPRRQ